MNQQQMTDAELAEYWKRQTIHYRNLSNTYLQQLLATKTTPERHYGKTTLHKDPVGNQAATNVDRERKHLKGQP